MEKVKSNGLVPLPNPEAELNMNGMPLSDGEKVELNNINYNIGWLCFTSIRSKAFLLN